MSWSFNNRYTSSSPKEKQQAIQWKYPFQSIIFEQKELILKALIPSVFAVADDLFPTIQSFFHSDKEFEQIIASCFLAKTTKGSILIDEIGDLILTLPIENFFNQVQDLMHDLLLPIEQSPNWNTLWEQKHTHHSDPYLQDLIAGAFLSKMMDFLIHRLKDQGVWNDQARQQIAATKAACVYPKNVFFINECENQLQHEIKRQMARMIFASMEVQEKSTSMQKLIANNIFFKLLEPLTAHKIYLRELKSVQNVFEKIISEECSSPYHLKESPPGLSSQLFETMNFFDLMESAFTEFKTPKKEPDSSLIVRPRTYTPTAPMDIPQPVARNRQEEDSIEQSSLKKTKHSIEKTFRPKLEMPVPKVANPQHFFNLANSSRSTEEDGLLNKSPANSSRSTEEDRLLNEPPTRM